VDLRDVKVIWRQVPKTIGRGDFGGRLAFAPDVKLFIRYLQHARRRQLGHDCCNDSR
jgi:glucose/arabinose dehydrogenase